MKNQPNSITEKSAIKNNSMVAPVSTAEIPPSLRQGVSARPKNEIEYGLRSFFSIMTNLSDDVSHSFM
jgi:hypothetical protein